MGIQYLHWNARRLDITVFDKLHNLVTFVDVAAPADKKVDKENARFEKYQDLIE